MELAISSAALVLRTPVQTIALIAGFVFFYALAKEGIPRLLYAVSVYRYFVDPSEYSRIVGRSNGLNILAALVGTCLAGWLVAAGSWRVALVFDAVTFVVFGLAILLWGRDPSPDQEKNVPKRSEEPKAVNPALPGLAWIQALVPLLFGVNALIWNYLPLLNDRLAVLDPTFSIFLIALLRTPGMIAGLFMHRILKKVPAGKIVFCLPILYLAGSVGFSAVPSVVLFCALVVLQGLVSGAYWPTDFALRNQLSGPELIRFNTTVLRKLAITQFVGCLLALWAFSPGGPGLTALPAISLFLIGMSVIYYFAAERGRLATPALTLLLGIVLLNGTGCHSSSKERKVVLPSVSKNLELRPDLTYAATAILNDTSAHFVRLSQDLTIQGDALSRYESVKGGRQYLLDLNPDYRSARGESVTGDDIAFTVSYYLAEKRGLSGPLAEIDGAEDCRAPSCSLQGLEILSPTRIRVTLKEPDLKWVDKLASPWLLLLKRGKPVTERIGSCTLPYQTGLGQVTVCDADGVHMRVGGQTVVVTADASQASIGSNLLTESPSNEVSPSLTVLAAFANPNSKKMSERNRVRFLTRIRSNSKIISTALHLKSATLLTPEWLGIEAPPDLFQVESHETSECPSQLPIHVLLDTSLPRLPVLMERLRAAFGCPIYFSTTNADTYFSEFSKADIGVAWFTPDFLDLYNIFAPFDCSTVSDCPFNWHDPMLQRQISRIKRSSVVGETDKKTALEIERLLLRRGYAAPMAEMNWWIRKQDGLVKSVHPAGLFQVRVSDFL